MAAGPGKGAAGAALLALLLFGGCDQLGRSKAPDGRVSRMQRDRYLQRAVHESSHGVLFEPSKVPEKETDRFRITELARAMQEPAARCFVERAIQSMELVEGEDGPGFEGVPDGQLKLRARIGPDGQVLRTEMLESAMKDPGMEQCILQVAAKIVFPPTRHGSAWHVDIYFWASLGFDRAGQTAERKDELRKQTAMASIRAKSCFEGRVATGRHEIEGLNLFNADGNTITNRVERGELPPEVSACVVTAFRNIKIPAEPESFVRPAVVRGTFEVGSDGVVKVMDEEWLRLVLLEERAKREQLRRELAGDAPSDAHRGTDQADPGEGSAPPAALVEHERPREEVDPEERRDPARPGVIDLNPR